ncbi:uncharacterized protein LOC110462753 [Mizuhopecten yessoensis]|uniref:Uncharacterized protein n=1 Tax=Mizuhopecten yessoensis TaxID=6573 RepID=A0A210PXL1_MIZYE|nr:uncharacterized protein LOC110462753 [Mizuhopecten yessoensis]OWF41238.1 hypothetical protein KP79_PYT21418 [Mizuhopecten yessoensis]
MANVSSSDLLWDHAGEDLEDNPLINTYSTDTPARQRGNRRAVHDIDREGVQLSYYQTVKLLENLEESSETLKQYLEDLNESSQENDRDTTTINSSMRQRFCQKCLRALQQITGTKTIIFTLLLQGINLLIQTIIDIWSKKDDDNAIVVSCVTMIVLQLVNLILIMFSSVKLAQQLVGRKVNGILMVQSYFASILLFAGLYTVTSRLKPGSWKDIRESVEESPGLIIALYTKFLYFSVSTATLCGTASTSPFEWYNYIFVSLQMLLSFMYFASILGHALTPFAGESPKQTRLRAISAARREPDAITPCIRATPLPANYGTINDG